MIKPDVRHAKTLEEFYSELTRLQAGAHGGEYVEHHNALVKCAKECEVIKEIGVCQGATFAALLMQHPKKLIGMDNYPKHYYNYQKLFDDYAKEHNVDLEFIEGDSHDPKHVHEVDMLHIDSLHTPAHLIGELRLHAPKVRKYIVFHDTANYKTTKGLFPTIAKYITEEEQKWRVIDHYIQRVGYTVIERVENRLDYKG